MEPLYNNSIKALIEDTNEAFFSCGTVNTDYADFAAMAIGDFRTVMKRPALTAHELKQLLRSAICSHKAEDPDSSLAAYITDHVIHDLNRQATLAAFAKNAALGKKA